MKLYFASTNKHKYEELKALLSDHEVVFPSDEGIAYSAEETGNNFFENAYCKVLSLYKEVNTPVIADDSGLCIDALNGAPGIFSARYGSIDGHNSNPSVAMDKVLAEMQECTNRRCRFICCMIVMLNEHEFYSVQQAFEGEITYQKQGEGGFGYDPIVFIPALRKTVAELSRAEKNMYSHRGRAVVELKRLLS